MRADALIVPTFVRTGLRPPGERLAVLGRGRGVEQAGLLKGVLLNIQPDHRGAVGSSLDRLQVDRPAGCRSPGRPQGDEPDHAWTDRLARFPPGVHRIPAEEP